MLNLLVDDYVNKMILGYENNLKIILKDEGVNTSDEDNMDSLIAKVDEEFDRQVVPAGDAVAEDVIAGKTFMNSSGEILTGTATLESSGGYKIVSGTDIVMIDSVMTVGDSYTNYYEFTTSSNYTLVNTTNRYKFTAKYTGWYIVTMHTVIPRSSANMFTYGGRCVVKDSNGNATGTTGDKKETINTGGSGKYAAGIDMAWNLYFNPGDYVEFYMYTSSSAEAVGCRGITVTCALE
jgi:hypothetical protein